MRLPMCENQVLILKELKRADTVAYFRTDVNNPLARFGIERVLVRLRVGVRVGGAPGQS